MTAQRRRSARVALAAAVAGLVSAFAAAPALAAFPYTRAGGDPTDYTDLYLGDDNPNDIGGEEFKLAATPDPGNGPSINSNPVELNGIRGARVVDVTDGVDTAWRTTTGRPDVTIAVMDSGIKWNEAGAMNDLRLKTRINQGELPVPETSPGTPCATAAADPYDCDDNGVVNVDDYASDYRINLSDPRRVGPPGVLTPQDILIAFSNDTDSDGNGFVDDIAGWDFLDNDNDAFDDVQYGHGTGEAEGSTAEADNGDTIGTCPNCMSIPMRVGDSFIADVNRFAQAVLYAADNDVEVVQSALGTLNNSSLARSAVEYAYRHGTTMVVSAADEAAQHNNQPYLPHTILVNSVTDSPFPASPTPPGKSYLSFNGCTNFNAKITLSVPSTSCSSDAVGLSSGYVGLVYSAAYTAFEKGALDEFPSTALCQLTRDSPLTGNDSCIITPNEVRQVLASGRIDGVPQPDDVNFAGTPPQSDNEPACLLAPSPPGPGGPGVPGCTNPGGPGGAVQAQVDLNRTSFAGMQAVFRSYPARKGHDQFYGYGRVNALKAVDAVLRDPAAATPAAAWIPPNVEITSPEWNQQVDPDSPSFDVSGQVYARGGSFTCQVYVAPGHYPNNRLTTQAPPGDFKPVGNGACDGATTHSAALDGTLATLDFADLESRFPAATDFGGREPGPGPQTSNGRPANEPHGFVVKVVATTTQAGATMTGEDQRAAYLHRDQDMLPGFPKGIGTDADGDHVIAEAPPTGDGESSPVLADLDGDNRSELIIGGSDGWVHALRPDGTELAGWPVRGDQPPLHTGGEAFTSGEIDSDIGGAILASLAVADANRDGIPEVFAADLEGKVYGWNAQGQRVFAEESEPDFSGQPLAPFENVRQGETNRTQHGFIGSPVLADLDGQGGLEVIAAAMDRHLYAWHFDGSEVTGFPVLVVDETKLDGGAPNGGIDPTTHAITFAAGSGAQMNGAIVDTPAVADLAGDARPEIVVGTNEEYDADDDGGLNVAPANGSSTTLLEQAQLGTAAFKQQAIDACEAEGFDPDDCDEINQVPDPPIKPANSRLYAIHPDGEAHGGGPFLTGWPKKIGILISELLPIVGEGITGYPVIGAATCPQGGAGPKIGALPNNGAAYVFNPDGSSCYGSSGGDDVPLQTDGYANQPDHPMLPAVGLPVFADLDGTGLSFLAPAAGLVRALDLGFPEYQPAGQDFLGAWSVSGAGQIRPGFPQAVNDLQFLTGPSVADLDGVGATQEILEGTASKDLAGLTPAGTPISPAWPKVTTDWTVANPTVGSWGTLDTDPAARKAVVALTRSGYVNAYTTDAPSCTPSVWPRFHHDNANSGDYGRDAVLPGKPMDASLVLGSLSFRAPGDDLLCGTADGYEIRTSPSPIDESTFDSATPLADPPAPANPGTAQSFTLPSGAQRYVAVRAVDEQGNVGRVAALDTQATGAADGAGAGPKIGPCANLKSGSSAAEKLIGTRGGDRLLGRGGNDRLSGRRGADCLAGGRGDDRIKGGKGRDKIKGGRGDDRILAARRGRDKVRCGAGDDVAFVHRGDSVKGCESVRRPG